MTQAVSPFPRHIPPLSGLLAEIARLIANNGLQFLSYRQKPQDLPSCYLKATFHVKMLDRFKRSKSHLLNVLSGEPRLVIQSAAA